MYRFKYRRVFTKDRGDRVSIHYMYRFKRFTYNAWCISTLFQYITCIGSRCSFVFFFCYCYVSIHYMYRFKTGRARGNWYASLFQYITCIGSRYSVKVVDVSGGVFQYITCIGSRHFLIFHNLQCSCFNTLHVSVQVGVTLATSTDDLSFNTLHVSVQDEDDLDYDNPESFQYITCIGSSIS